MTIFNWLALGASGGGSAAPPIDPLTLFASGEQGTLLVPQDDSTALFAERTGVTNSVDDGVVGLHLDASRFAGVAASSYITAASELVAANWTAGTGWTQNSAGNFTANNVAANTEVSRSGLLSVNTWYVCDLTWSGITANLTWRLYGLQFTSAFDLNQTTHGSSGSRRIIFRTPASGTVTALRALSANMSGNFTLSFKALPGLHAVAPADGQRPLKRATGFLDFDGSDDVLQIPIATSLGADCTTVLVTGSGATITAGQTIGAGTHSIPTSDWFAYLIVNRALTGAEQAGVNAWAEELIA